MPGSIVSLPNEEEKTQLFSKSSPLHCEAGLQLFERGKPAENMYLVERGKVSLFRLIANGDEKLFRVFMAGEMIAEMAVFMSPRTYPMSARVDQDTELSVLYYRGVLTVFTQSPQTSLKVMNYMANRIHQLMDTINILTQVNANQRLVMKLADLYRAQSRIDGKITLSVTKKLLAIQLGMTPETLSRAFKKLKSDGFITEYESHITLLDIPAMCEAVELTPEIFRRSKR
ncbi:Crp/Fnr family transcriptional regulator [Vibrio alginolyticus]|uniref:Crp/Fnr family transcriptional regulator n=1 Tax=Vibrio alginolyticus TaxID=663 RepID=UPI002F423A62